MVTDQSKQLYRFLLVAGIVIVAFNLRPAITSVGPLIGTIRDDIGLSNWSAGMLTSLPLIAFAIMSPLVPKLANRYSDELTLIIGLALLLVGVSVRSISVIILLFIGTLLVGLGIAILNVLLPGVIKEKFPGKVGLMTSIYTTSMGIFAASASGLSVPFAQGLDLGWQFSLLVWAAPAVLGIIVWTYISMKDKSDEEPEHEMQRADVSDNHIWKSPLAWQVAIFMGMQSFLFYVTISWLPEILHYNGLSMATAGWMLSFAQFVGLPASFLVPVIADRLKSQGRIVLVIGICAITGYSGLLLGESFPIMVISTMLIGLTLSGMFALALTFLGMRARNARHAGILSAMAQSLGYCLAAVGPMFIGYLYDVSHTWSIPLMTMIGVAILVVTFGMFAGRDRYVLD